MKDPKPASQSIQAREDVIEDVSPRIATLTLDSDIATSPTADVENVSANGSHATTSTTVTKSKNGRTRKPKKYILKEDYLDIIKDAFWETRPWILA